MTVKTIVMASLLGLTTLFSSVSAAMMPGSNEHGHPSNNNYAHYQQPYPMANRYYRPHHHGFVMRRGFRGPGVAVITRDYRFFIPFGHRYRW